MIRARIPTRYGKLNPYYETFSGTHFNCIRKYCTAEKGRITRRGWIWIKMKGVCQAVETHVFDLSSTKEAEAGKASSQTARATHGNPILKNIKTKQTK